MPTAKPKPLSSATTAFLKRINAVWRWTGNAFQWAGWLRRKGVTEESIMHLANRIALNKIQNPFSLQELAHVISQNIAEQKHVQASRAKEMPRDKAPELLSSIFKRAGM